MKKLFAFLPVLLLSSCFFGEPIRENFEAEGYVPVYGSPSVSEVKLLSPQVVKNPGKIYLYGSFLLVNEINRGIHIFNNADPSHPQAVAFVEILGNSDMAIKDNTLFADHIGNLIALKTIDFTTLEKKGELPINSWLAGLPPPAGHYFECVDESNGIVVSWKKSTLKNPACYANNSSW
jgi:hypothetical protein